MPGGKGSFGRQQFIRPQNSGSKPRKGNTVFSNVAKFICGLVLVVIAAGCTGHGQAPPEKLAEMSRDDFISALRWKQYQVAASLMKPEFRDAFLDTFTALKDIHIVDVRLINLKEFQEGRRFETTVEMDYYLLPSVTVKTFRFQQTWIYFEGEDPALQGFLITTPFPKFP